MSIISAFFAESAELTSEGKLVFRGVKAEFVRSVDAPVADVFEEAEKTVEPLVEKDVEAKEEILDDLDGLCDIFTNLQLGKECSKRQREPETLETDVSDMKRSRSGN